MLGVIVRLSQPGCRDARHQQEQRAGDEWVKELELLERHSWCSNSWKGH